MYQLPPYAARDAARLYAVQPICRSFAFFLPGLSRGRGRIIASRLLR